MHVLNSKIFLKFILIGFFLVEYPVFALSNDRQQPIKIEADSAVIDDAKGIATYSGSVLITQGTIQINANKVTLNYTAKQTLDKVVAEGDPVRFKQTPDGGKEDINARAKRMEYFADKGTIHLTNGAELSQGKDAFSGEHISYNVQDGVIRADKGDSKQGRISVTIQPRPSQSSQPPPASQP